MYCVKLVLLNVIFGIPEQCYPSIPKDFNFNGDFYGFWIGILNAFHARPFKYRI
uniref:Uncharacterized protein n=1 Tax=Rhizophora mucronata TaxID=61149 RepID=A0A2P2N0Y9_RHIMU